MFLKGNAIYYIKSLPGIYTLQEKYSVYYTFATTPVEAAEILGCEEDSTGESHDEHHIVCRPGDDVENLANYITRIPIIPRVQFTINPSDEEVFDMVEDAVAKTGAAPDESEVEDEVERAMNAYAREHGNDITYSDLFIMKKY